MAERKPLFAPPRFVVGRNSALLRRSCVRHPLRSVLPPLPTKPCGFTGPPWAALCVPVPVRSALLSRCGSLAFGQISLPLRKNAVRFAHLFFASAWSYFPGARPPRFSPVTLRIGRAAGKVSRHSAKNAAGPCPACFFASMPSYLPGASILRASYSYLSRILPT